VLGRNIGSYVSKKPEALTEAALAWTKPFANSDEQAVAYLFQWNNPRPGVPIQAIDLFYASEQRVGVPAVLAITAVE